MIRSSRSYFDRDFFYLNETRLAGDVAADRNVAHIVTCICQWTSWGAGPVNLSKSIYLADFFETIIKTDKKIRSTCFAYITCDRQGSYKSWCRPIFPLCYDSHELFTQWQLCCRVKLQSLHHRHRHRHRRHSSHHWYCYCYNLEAAHEQAFYWPAQVLKALYSLCENCTPPMNPIRWLNTRVRQRLPNKC